MKLTEQIDFQNVEELSRALMDRKFTPERFSLEIPVRDACNGIYSAIKAEVAVRGGSVSLDQETREHIALAAEWLTDSRSKPGLLLYGGVGNGKTTMAKAIGNLIGYLTKLQLGYDKRKSVKFIKAKDICELRARADKFKDSRDEYDNLFREEILTIDELGEEPKEMMIFGQPNTPLIDLLYERYDKMAFTIITTNLGSDSLKEKYGERIYDRFKEWMALIPFTNDSFRK